MAREPPFHASIGDIWLDVSVRESHQASAEVSEHPVEVGSPIADHVRPLPRTIEIEGMVTNHPIEKPLTHANDAELSSEPLQLIYAANPLPRIAPDSMEIEGEPAVPLVGPVPGVGQATALLGALHIDITSKRRFAAGRYTVDEKARRTVSANVVRFTEEFDRVTEVHLALLEIIDESHLVEVVTGLHIYQNVALTNLIVERSAKTGRDQLSFTATGRVLRMVASEVVTLPKAKATKSRGKQATTPVDPNTVPAPGSTKSKDAFGYGHKEEWIAEFKNFLAGMFR